MLDIGAFDGAFLERLPCEWERLAIEPSRNGRLALASHGVRVISDALENPAVEYQQTCDAVCLFDVFEHLLNPTAALLSAMSYLKPGGLLLVSTGNVDHWSWRLLRGEHWYLDSVQHIRFASRRYFHWLARRYGHRLCSMRSLSHQTGTLAQVLRETAIDVYFGLQSDGRLQKLLKRALGCLPPVRRVRHKPSPPYTQTIADHVLAVFEKSRDCRT